MISMQGPDFIPWHSVSSSGESSVSASAAAREVFSPDYQNPTIRASGTLLYAFHGNKTYVLLSKHDSSDEKHACNTDKWESFGGFKEPGLTLVENAFHETWEESRGLISLSYDTTDHRGMVVFEQQNTYLQLLVRIEYDPTLLTTFRHTRVPKPADCDPNRAYNPFMEKLEIRWVPLEDLIHDLRYVEYSVVKDKTDKETRIPHCAVWDKDRDENLHLRPAFIATMSSLVAAAPEVINQVVNQSIIHHDSPLVISDSDGRAK